MAQQITDVLSSADCSPQGLDGGLNLKADPTRLAPPATTRSDNAHYDTIGSVSQMPGLVSTGLNGAKHVYNLHARDTGSPGTSGDVLVHGEFNDGTFGYTASVWTPQNNQTVTFDQPVLPFSVKTRNLAGRLNASQDAEYPPNCSREQLMFCREEAPSTPARRRFAMLYYTQLGQGLNPTVNWTMGYCDGMTEYLGGRQVLPSQPLFVDAIGVQNTQQWFLVRDSGSTSLDILKFSFVSGYISTQTVTGVTQFGGATPLYKFFNHAGRTYLAYYTNVATPILNFLDVVSGATFTTPIGGTLTTGFTVFSPYTHQTQTGSQFLALVKNLNVYVLHRPDNVSNWSLVGGASALPASNVPLTTNRVYVTGAALISDNQGGVGGSAMLNLTIFRTFSESIANAIGTTTHSFTNVAVDQYRFVANVNPNASGNLIYNETNVARFPSGAMLACKAFNICPPEANFAGVSNAKQSLCMVRSGAMEFYPGYPTPPQGTTGGGYTFGQSTYFLIDHRARIVGRFLDSQAGFEYGTDSNPNPGISALGTPLFSVPGDLSDDQAALTITLPCWSLVSGSPTPAVTVGTSVYAQFPPTNLVFCPAAATLSLSNVNASVPAVQAGPYTVMSGAMTVCHDGNQVAEANYNFITPNPVPVALTSGTALGAAGVYTYVAVHEWYDAQGQLVRSQPSVPTPLTVTGTFYGATVYVPRVPSSKISSYPNVIRTRLYRSINGSKNDSNFYFCASLLYDASSNKTRNTMDTMFVSFGDTKYLDNAVLATGAVPPSNAINAQPRLYTGITAATPNPVFASSPAPSFFWQTSNQGRFFGLAQILNQFRLYYTAQNTSGLAPEWNFNNYAPIPYDMGDARSVEAIDRSVVVFGTRYIGVLTGYGPLPYGATGVPNPGDNFDPFFSVPSPAGVIGSGAPARTPDGIVFQGTSGLQLLERGLTVSSVGAPIDPLTGRQIGNTGQILGRAMTLPGLQSVVWPNAKGAAITYAYLTKKFGTWPLLSNAGILVQRMDGNIVVALQPILGPTYAGPATSTIQGCELGILAASSYAPVNLLQNSNPSLVLETPWILPGGASGGEARVWNACITGTWLGAHTLQIEQAYNYEPYSLTRTIDMSVQPRQYQAIVQPLSNTRMVSVRYRISLLPITNLTAGYLMATLSDLVLFSAKQQGTVRTSSALRS